MDINTLIEDISAAVANDADTAEWCEVTYGQQHKVYINLDHRDPPGESDCPYFVLYPDIKSVGSDVQMKAHGFEAVCCIHDDESETRAEGNITEYKGVKRLEAFRKLCETAIDGVDLENGYIAIVDVDYDTIDNFPFMMAAMAVMISKRAVIGEDPLL